MKTSTPVFTQSIAHTITSFINSDGTNAKTIATAATNDSRVIHITITSTDTASNVAYFSLTNGVDTAIISYCNIPNGSGTNGTNDAIAVLSSTSFSHRKLDNNANPYFELANGWQLQMKLANAVSAGATITVLVTQEDY